jgi:DNA-binding SARP family transcriptional activator/tetratricopeptide (TPR) repeat protein
MTPPIRLLGCLEVDVGDQAQELGPTRQRTVLAVLLLAAPHPIAAEEIVMRVWGEDPPRGARQALRTYICRLRHAVAGSNVLRIDRANGGYVAAFEHEDLDLFRFRRLVAAARRARDAGDADDALTGFTEALGLWRDVALAGVNSDWLDNQRTTLGQERLCVELDHNDLALQRGEHARILPALTTQLADEPFDERVAGQLMLALQASGRASDALGVYDRIRRRLRDELGTEPARGLREIHELVLRADESPGPRRSGVRAARLLPRQLPPALVGFVDRTSERQALDKALTGDETGPRIAILSGTGGVGKTSLAVRWAREHVDAFPDGQLFIDLQGFDSERPPLAPEAAIHTFLLALGADPAALPVDLNALTGMYRSMLEGRRVLIIADNARCSEQVRPLLPAGPLNAALVTSRSGLARILTDHGAQVIHVGMLGPCDARALIRNRLGTDRVEQEAASVDILVAHCAGLPLALAIVAGRAAMTPHLPLAVLADELSDDTTRLDGLRGGEPGSDVRATLDASVSVLPAQAVTAFGLMALAPGPSLSLAGFTAMTGLTRSAATTVLRDLTASQLVEQDRPGRFRMHDLVRLYATGLGRSHPHAAASVRRLLRHYLDAATGMASARQTPETTSGQDFVSVEAPSLIAAVDLAIAEGHDGLGCDLAAAIEEYLGARGCWRDIVRVNTTTAAAARRLEDADRLVRAEVGLGRGLIGMREFACAAAHLDLALDLARSLAASGPLARVHRALARLAAHEHRHTDALHHDECSLELHLAAGDRTGEATAYNAIGWHQAHLGEPERALVNCHRALAIFDETGDRSGQAMTLDSVGFALGLLDRHTEAQKYYQRSASLAAELSWHVARADTLRRLARSYLCTGQDAEARLARREADEMLRLTGHPGSRVVSRPQNVHAIDRRLCSTKASSNSDCATTNCTAPAPSPSNRAAGMSSNSVEAAAQIVPSVADRAPAAAPERCYPARLTM